MKHIKEHTISHMWCPSLNRDIISFQISICIRPNNSFTHFLMSTKWDFGHFTHEIIFMSSIWLKIIENKELFFILLVYLWFTKMVKFVMLEICDYHKLISCSHQYKEQHHWVTETWDHYHKSTIIKFTRRRVTFVLYINFKIILP